MLAPRRVMIQIIWDTARRQFYPFTNTYYKFTPFTLKAPQPRWAEHIAVAHVTVIWLVRKGTESHVECVVILKHGNSNRSRKKLMMLRCALRMLGFCKYE